MSLVYYFITLPVSLYFLPTSEEVYCKCYCLSDECCNEVAPGVIGWQTLVRPRESPNNHPEKVSGAL